MGQDAKVQTMCVTSDDTEPIATPPVAPILLDRRGLAAALCISTRTTYRLVEAGELPAPVKIGGSQRWLRSEIEAAIERLPRKATK